MRRYQKQKKTREETPLSESLKERSPHILSSFQRLKEPGAYFSKHQAHLHFYLIDMQEKTAESRWEIFG